MVGVTHMIGVEDSLIDNMYHNCRHTPPQKDEVEATNIAKKLILEFWQLQNVQPLVCHDNVLRLASVGDHQEDIVGFDKTENHKANRTNYSQYRGFALSRQRETWR